MLRLETVKLEDMLFGYMYDGFLDLLFAIIVHESEHCIHLFDKHHKKYNCIMDILIDLLEGFIAIDDQEGLFPYAKVENLLGVLTTKRSYIRYKERLTDISNKFFEKVKQNNVRLFDDNSVQSPRIKSTL